MDEKIIGVSKENRSLERESQEIHVFFQWKIIDFSENLKKIISFFQRKRKDLNEHLKKIIGFSKQHQRFQR